MIGGSRAWINGVFAGRFEVFIFGGKNTVFSWSQMAFVAPLDNLEGSIQRLVLKDGVQSPGQGSPTPAPTPTTTPGEPATGAAVAASINTAMIVVLLCVLVGPLSMSLV
jgi:hexosaminidase